MRNFAIVVLLAVLAVPAAAQRSAEEARLELLRAEALNAVNRDRLAHHLPPLRMADTLNESAQAHAEDMLERNYFAHKTPEGDSVADRHQRVGGSRWRLTSENIATCTRCPTPPTRNRIVAFEQGWMDSPGHRENILDPGLTRFGFGMAWDRGRVYGVQNFDGPGGPRDSDGPEGPELDGPSLAARMLERINAARAEAGAPPLTADPGLAAAADRLGSLSPEALITPSLADSPYDALAPSDRPRWAAIRFMAARCGGCGARPTAEDAESFAQGWLGRGSRRSPPLDPDLTHLGFALKADGAGMKTAVLCLAESH